MKGTNINCMPLPIILFTLVCPGASRRQCNGRCQVGSVVLDCADCNREPEDGEGATNEVQEDDQENVIRIETFIQTYIDGSHGGNVGNMYCSCKSGISFSVCLH